MACKEVTAAIRTTSDYVFRYTLETDGLALRGAAIAADGTPELRFGASPNVPTITEEDVATIYRLVMEYTRPGIFYTHFPIGHPLHESRLFTRYTPAYLRWTSIGKLLADADWNMKCLHVGARTNQDKSVYRSWQSTSQLEGLATRLDFPKDETSGPTMMSCKSATVQKSDNEIMFPREPEMQIVDQCSSLYTKYITKFYNSVAYYDEPVFLKMRELIKLILAVEWLYNEKGIRASKRWVMEHTSKLKDKRKVQLKRKKPPYKMIPKTIQFERPPSDVKVKTWEAGMYDSLKSNCGVRLRYGYYDFGNAELIMFKDDGLSLIHI